MKWFRWSDLRWNDLRWSNRDPIPFLHNLRGLYTSAIPEQSPDFHLIIGDFGYFIRMQFHLNMVLSLFFIIGNVSQIIHFYDYLCGRGQPYMNVFNMMSGKISPHSFGLSNPVIIRVLLTQTRRSFKINDLFLKFSPYLAI